MRGNSVSFVEREDGRERDSDLQLRLKLPYCQYRLREGGDESLSCDTFLLGAAKQNGMKYSIALYGGILTTVGYLKKKNAFPLTFG